MGRRILAALAALLALLWAAVAPMHRSTVANILIYLAIALATAAVITLVAGIIKSRKAKGEEAREKHRRQEEQKIEEYDE